MPRPRDRGILWPKPAVNPNRLSTPLASETEMPNTLRRRYRKKRARKSGLPPGALVGVGDALGPTQMTRTLWSGEALREDQVADLTDIGTPRPRDAVTWINVAHAHQAEVVRRLGEVYGLHPLVQEDILNHDQRPKVEDHGNCLFVVLKILGFNDEAHELTAEQLSLVLGPDYLLSFQEVEGGATLEPVRERLRAHHARTRQGRADQLAYAILDAVVDEYFVALEKLEDHVEDLENDLLSTSRAAALPIILQLKRQTLFLRHAVWPLREVVAELQRAGGTLVSDETRVYLRDLYDHVVQVMDMAEDLRETVAGLLDLYLSTLNLRLNEVMKVLTLFTAVFIPLTFCVGVYGMNFRHMPELDWWWAYPALWVLMVAVGGGMVAYFRHRRWL